MIEIAGFPAADALAKRPEGGGYRAPRFAGSGEAGPVLNLAQEFFVLHEPFLSPLSGAVGKGFPLPRYQLENTKQAQLRFHALLKGLKSGRYKAKEPWLRYPF